MVTGKKMQNPYGSSESERVDGTATSSFVSWDSKISTVNALLGGVGSFVREKMKDDGIYNEFLYITNVSYSYLYVGLSADILQREYNRVFTTLKGENVALCVPNTREPDKGLQDYTDCAA